MRRRLLNLLAALSVLLCFAVVTLWVRSYTLRDMRGLTVGRHSVWATSRLGTLELEWLRWDDPEGFAWQAFTSPAIPPRPQEWVGNVLEEWQQQTVPPASRVYRTTTERGTPRVGIVFPDWVLLLVSALLPAARLVGVARRRRVRAGRCRVCGYDLTANVSGTCPECGNATAAPDGGRFSRAVVRGVAYAAPIASLALCLTAAVLWVRSYFVWDTFLKRFPDCDYSVESARGRFAWCECDYGGVDRSFYVQPQFGRWTHETSEADSTPDEGLRTAAGVSDTWFVHGGFVIGLSPVPGRDPDEVPTRALVAPYWSACLATLLLPAFVLLRGRSARNRGRVGLCACSGYDLRATPDRCPECGTPVTQPVA